MRINKGGRIIFEVAVEFDETSLTWVETIRVWVRRHQQALNNHPALLTF